MMKTAVKGLLLGLLLLALPASARTLVLPIDRDVIELDIWPQSEFVLDAGGILDLDAMRQDQPWQETTNQASSFSYVQGSLWIRTRIQNDNSERIHLFLDHPYTLTDEIAVYVWHQDRVIQKMVAGDRVETQGAVAHARNPLFDLQLPPGESILYIKVKSSALVSGRFDLWTPLPYFNKVNRELVFVAVLLGSLGILVLYNLFLYFSLRSRVYLHYVVYLLAFLNIQIVFSGVSRIFLTQASAPLIFYWNEGVHMAVKLAWAFALSFAAQFLNLSTYHPTLNRIVRSLVVVMFGCLLTGVFLSYGQDSAFMVFLTVCASLLLLGLGIWSSLRRYRPAYYYTAGWAILLLATGVAALKTAGVLPINLFTTWAQIIGAAIEGLVLSLALGERYNYEQKRAAQERESFIKKLIEKEASKAHSYSQLEKIIYPHQIELIKGGSNLEQTMPTGQSEACVISFDTIGSSKIDRKKARSFLNDAFALCYRDMLAGYDPKRLQASAYRLKEVGDGFFCSVGFPFHTPSDLNPAEIALQLALQFSNNFRTAAVRHGLRMPQASIAIAFGEVEAYYTQAGVVEYNMFGRGIILADRYEKLRKGALRGWHFSGNLLVIDERVFGMLGESSQRMFQRFDIDAIQQTIRDDEQAHGFYFTELFPEAARTLPVSA